jgi:protein-S-isoprenylcysteine O-methyltransferase Ste14
MRSLELQVPPLAIVLGFAVAMTAIAYLVPAASVEVPARIFIAVVLAAAGAVIAMAGVAAFRKWQTTVNPLAPDRSSTLVATGIYRYSRNPMYLGFLLALAGWGVYLANWATAPLPFVFIACLTRFQIEPEERALSAKFGPQFEAYCRAVRRWL